MLRLIVGDEGFDDSSQTFVKLDPVVLELEHSLASLSKWESKHVVPFLSHKGFTQSEIWDYIECMVVTPTCDSGVLAKLSSDDVETIQKYIDSPQSATTFGAMPERPGRGEVITAELIYYWMVVFKIPFECESWHLNRLFSLIRICNIKNSKPTKQNTHDAAVERARINAERRERLGTRG